jgi:MazG family protein
MKKRRRSIDQRAARAASRFARLVRIMDTLRSKHGCPWDRKQTHKSLRPYLLEETYEALEAIDRGDWHALPGELGDVLLQCVFHAQLAAERGDFDAGDAVEAINQKLIRRHPHVFTPSGRPLGRRDAKRSAIRTPAAVKEQWARIKAAEKGTGSPNGNSGPRRVLDGIPRAMPALLRAHEIGMRVAGVGFDWAEAGDVVDKMDEEVRELRDALNESPDRAAEELGDLLFSIANLARKLKLDPESALRQANEKFTQRFDAVEKSLEKRGRSIHGATIEEMNETWALVKQQ